MDAFSAFSFEQENPRTVIKKSFEKATFHGSNFFLLFLSDYSVLATPLLKSPF